MTNTPNTPDSPEPTTSGRKPWTGGKTAVLTTTVSLTTLILGIIIGAAGSTENQTTATQPEPAPTATVTVTPEPETHNQQPNNTDTNTNADTEADADAGEIGSGTWKIGDDIRPGQWSTDGASMCTYERLSGLSGEYSDVIAANVADGPTTVEVSADDVAFKTTGNCTWTRQGSSN